jgi:2-oxoisovalerate dehydrogenase E1 component alpha subunit
VRAGSTKSRAMQTATAAIPSSTSKRELPKETLLQMHSLMLRARLLEERLIRMQKQGDGYFWIGGPGEEAFNIPFGMLVHKGQGPEFDYLHLHYRSNAVALAMGADPVDFMRQMKNTASDPFSRGRNFAGHPSIRKWNLVPVSSPIEVQYAMAPGTAIANKRAGGKGISIVTGGDAGTAEGEFASCMIWSTRPGNELPVLMVVTNNQFGISTPAATQHGEQRISDRGKAFGMRTATIDGQDPEYVYFQLQEVMEYVRRERKPFLLEVMVSRLYGHSSSSGANFVGDEFDCLPAFEKKLEERGYLARKDADDMRAAITQEYLEAAKRVREEAMPPQEDAFTHVFEETNHVAWKKGN